MKEKLCASVPLCLCTLCCALLFCLASPLQAATLTEVVTQIVEELAAVNPDTSNGIIVNVFHYITKKEDLTAEEISGELFMALRKRFPKVKMQDTREAGMEGTSLNAIWLDVAFEPKGHEIRLTSKAKTGMDKNSIKETIVTYKAQAENGLMMGVFEMKSEVLQPSARKAFTKTFRTEMIRQGFTISSDTETQQQQMEELAKAGCSAEKCMIEVGKQNKMTHVVDLEYSELGKGYFQLTATIHDLKGGSSVSEYAQHDGNPGTVNVTIRELVGKLVPLFFKQQIQHEEAPAVKMATAEKDAATQSTFFSRFRDNWMWHGFLLAGILGTSLQDAAAARQYNDVVAENEQLAIDYVAADDSAKPALEEQYNQNDEELKSNRNQRSMLFNANVTLWLIEGYMLFFAEGDTTSRQTTGTPISRLAPFWMPAVAVQSSLQESRFILNWKW